ncbi:MAG: hypothetical protein WC277_08540 [Bacilli bacterium]
MSLDSLVLLRGGERLCGTAALSAFDEVRAERDRRDRELSKGGESDV